MRDGFHHEGHEEHEELEKEKTSAAHSGLRSMWGVLSQGSRPGLNLPSLRDFETMLTQA
jgi:hypothetical protein